MDQPITNTGSAVLDARVEQRSEQASNISPGVQRVA